MDKYFRQRTYEALADIFETVFLIPLETMDGGASSLGVGERRRDYLEVRIDLLRERNCPAFFFFPADLIKEIADSFMGLDVEAMDKEGLVQVAKMAARMTIGGLLARVDPGALIRAGEPQSRRIDNFTSGRLCEMPGAWMYKTGQGYLWVDVGRIGDFAHR
ncbi:MAG: hypothetical protein HGA96_09465 [Desulfobulbaceae bacterium]|nr:hypothetical protein [Desulfobulbaceae bacterium]